MFKCNKVLNVSNMENRDREIDDSFASFICNQFDPEYDYRSKTKVLSRDTRINKVRYNEYNKEYDDYQTYLKSDTYRDVLRSKNLLSSFEIDETDLRSCMQKNYSLSNQEYDRMIQALANDREVSIRKSPFDQKIKISKR